jgi:antitoxin component of MazEF toxin-antitoxin module
MSIALQIIQVGDEACVVLPAELVERRGLQVGGDVLLTLSGDGILLEFSEKPEVDASDAKP